MSTPHACHADQCLRGGLAGDSGSTRGSATVDMADGLGRGPGRRARPGHPACQPATSLMRAIISSTALSTGHFSLTTRFTAFIHTFSLLRIVNL